MTKEIQYKLSVIILIASSWAIYFIFGEWWDNQDLGTDIFDYTVGLTSGMFAVAFGGINQRSGEPFD